MSVPLRKLPGPQFCCAVDLCAHILKPPQDIQVAESQNANTKGFQILRSDIIFLCFARIVMLRAVQLHDKFCTVAIKIRDVIADDILSAKA